MSPIVASIVRSIAGIWLMPISGATILNSAIAVNPATALYPASLIALMIRATRRVFEIGFEFMS